MSSPTVQRTLFRRAEARIPPQLRPSRARALNTFAIYNFPFHSAPASPHLVQGSFSSLEASSYRPPRPPQFVYPFDPSCSVPFSFSQSLHPRNFVEYPPLWPWPIAAVPLTVEVKNATESSSRGTGATAFIERSSWCASEIMYISRRWRLVLGRVGGALGRGEDAFTAGISIVPSQRLAVADVWKSYCFFDCDFYS